MELPVGTLINNDKYTISSVLFRSKDGEKVTYQVADAAGKAYFCYDLGLLDPTGPQHDALQTGLTVLAKCQHANLARLVEGFSMSGREYVVFEFTEGPTLDSRQNLDDRHLLQFAQQACDLLGCLERQEPGFILDELDPTRLVVGSDGLVLHDYRLSRCLEKPARSVVGSEDADKAVTFTAMADFLSYLVTRKRGPADLARVKQINPKMALVIQRCQMYLEAPGYTFAEVRRSLSTAIEITIVKPRPGVDQAAQVWSLAKSLGIRNWIVVVTVLLVAVNLYQYFNHIFHPPKGIGGYVVVNDNTLMTIDTTNVRVVHTQSYDNAKFVGAALSVDHKQLMLADAGVDEIRLIETQTNKDLAPIPLPGAPEAVMTPLGGDTAIVSVPDKKTYVEFLLAPIIKMHGSFTTPIAGLYPTVSADGRYLFYASPDSAVIYATNLINHVNYRRGIVVKETGPMTISPDNKELWILGQKTGMISIIDLKKLQGKGTPDLCTLTDTVEGLPSHTTAIGFNYDGTEVYVLSPDDTAILVCDRHDRRVSHTVSTHGRNPVGWAFTSLSPPDLWVLDQSPASAVELDMGNYSMTRRMGLGGTPMFITTQPAPPAPPPDNSDSK